MTRRDILVHLVSSLGAFAWSACGSGSGGGSPTAPSASLPASDFPSQFDSLWTTFDREYSYFDYKRIDWNALRTAFRPRAIAATDQRDFISVIREMLAQLHDIHVVVRDPSGATLPTYQPQDFVNWDRAVWQQYVSRANWTQGQNDWGYGVLDDVPYIAIGGWGSSSIRTADFDAAFERFRSAPQLILDVRMNGGGNDQLAFDVAGRFARSPVTFGYVRFRNGPSHSDFGPPTNRTLSPRGAWQFTGNVLLLIGRRCASSNESFIAAMGLLPNVTVAGDRTAGGSGNPGTFPLASGWTYTVSRWMEFTAAGQPIEDVGIAPQIVVPATAADFAQGRDPVLDWALLNARPIRVGSRTTN
jgi:peptidase S41-like protein/tricorn protease-like protein